MEKSLFSACPVWPLKQGIFVYEGRHDKEPQVKWLTATLATHSSGSPKSKIRTGFLRGHWRRICSRFLSWILVIPWLWQHTSNLYLVPFCIRVHLCDHIFPKDTCHTELEPLLLTLACSPVQTLFSNKVTVLATVG